MFESDLFFGLCLSESDKQDLNRLSEAMRSFFISNGNPDYLQEIEVGGNFYLGKFLAGGIEFSSLELIGQNILSLTKRLLPTYSCDEHSLILLALPTPS